MMTRRSVPVFLTSSPVSSLCIDDGGLSGSGGGEQCQGVKVVGVVRFTYRLFVL